MIDALGAELGRQEAEEAGAGADIGHRGLARDDDALQRLVESRIADAVGEQRAVVLDAHRMDRHGPGTPVSTRNTYTIGAGRARWRCSGDDADVR